MPFIQPLNHSVIPIQIKYLIYPLIDTYSLIDLISHIFNNLPPLIYPGKKRQHFLSSAVSRTGDKRNGRERESPGDEKSSAYVPPGKRDSRGGFSRGRGQRTPPPNRYDNYEDRDQRQR